MILNRKLFAAAESQVSASPGVSTGTASPAAPLSPADSSGVSTGAEPKISPEKVFLRPDPPQ